MQGDPAMNEESRLPAVSQDRDRPSQALSDRVRHQIIELIQNRALSGGQTIIEQRLASELGVSRTPLREALQRLEGEGMVVKASGRSFIVRKVELQEYLQALKVRLLLEPEAAALAAARAPTDRVEAVRAEIEALRAGPEEHTAAHWVSDDNLHGLVGAFCGNQVLRATIDELRITTRLYEIEDVRQHVAKDLDQHAAIAAAIATSDAQAARKAMQTHLRSLVSYSLSHVA
jgi:DNA-binding GntR family transcriptional regulator